MKEILKLHSLHHFGRIVLLDHIDCGGFGIADEKQEEDSHFEYFIKGREKVASELPGIEFEPHLFGWGKEIIPQNAD